jgi:hypothetical protein
VWDADVGTELLELPRSGGCNFNAAWSPTVPGVFATASFDGKVQPQTFLDTLESPCLGTSLLEQCASQAVWRQPD